MTIKEAAALWPIIKAYAEGKTIEIYDTNAKSWHTIINPKFFPGSRYRIKPQSAYRSFKNADECWNEMQKHQPFGWVKSKEGKNYQVVTCILDEGEDAESDNVLFDCESGCVFFAALEQYTFADGTPFGIKEERENQ